MAVAGTPVEVKDLGHFDEAVPVSTGKLQETFYNYLFETLSPEEMSRIKKFVLVPIGLPGMGKTTLSRFLHHTCQNAISVGQTDAKTGLGMTGVASKLVNQTKDSIQTTASQLKLDFRKISYDDILTRNQQEYCA